MKNLRREIHNIANANRKKRYIGGDTFNFEMVIDGASENVFLDATPLKNNRNLKFDEVEVGKGKIHINICLPKFIDENNVMPFSMADLIMLETIKNDVESALNQALKGIIDDKIDVLTAPAKSIECNITKRVAGDSTCSQVLNLINRSFPEGTNVVFQRASIKCKYDKENETVIIRKRNYYVLKAYDKTLQQRKSGNLDVDSGLLRIELVMQDRTIIKMFCGKSTIREVLTERGLMTIIKEYKRIFLEDVIKEHILPCINDVVDILYKTLKEKDSQLEAIALHKELIMDEEILRRALVKWYKFNGYSEERAKRNADTYICRCRIKYGFPKNVIDTMREFKKLCD